MKNLKNRMLALALAAAMTLSLTACGGSGQSKNENDNDVVNTEPVVSQNVVETAAPLEYKLSSLLASGRTIWYDANPRGGKDAVVDRIYVFEQDGTAILSHAPRKENGSYYTLGELEQMEEDDIVAIVQKGYPQYVNEKLDQVVTLITDVQEKQLSDYDFFRQLLSNLVLSYDSRADFELGYLNGLDDERYGVGFFGIFPDFKDTFSTMTDQYWDVFHTETEEAMEVARELVGDMYEVWSLVSSGCQAYCIDELSICEFVVRNRKVSEDVALAVETIVNAGTEFFRALQDYCLNELSALEAGIAANRVAPQPSQYRLGIQTDSSGNRTEKMILAINTVLDLNISGTGKNNITYRTLTPFYGAGAHSGVEVYDSFYGGYTDSNIYYLLMKLDHDQQFKLDQVGTAGIPVDVNPHNLFD